MNKENFWANQGELGGPNVPFHMENYTKWVDIELYTSRNGTLNGIQYTLLNAR